MTSTVDEAEVPLPLIKPRSLKHKLRSGNPEAEVRNGYILLIATWFIFIVSTGSLFELWSIPNPQNSDFPISNYYTHAILLIPVAAWLWCVISWTGLKLFKHAKGGAIES